MPLSMITLSQEVAYDSRTNQRFHFITGLMLLTAIASRQLTLLNPTATPSMPHIHMPRSYVPCHFRFQITTLQRASLPDSMTVTVCHEGNNTADP